VLEQVSRTFVQCCWLERWVPELIPVLGSRIQLAGDVSHKPGGTQTLAHLRRQLETHLTVPALDSAGCSCECRVPSSRRHCCDCTASSAPTRNVQTRLDSTRLYLKHGSSCPRESATERRLDRFGRFCAARGHSQWRN